MNLLLVQQPSMLRPTDMKHVSCKCSGAPIPDPQYVAMPCPCRVLPVMQHGLEARSKALMAALDDVMKFLFDGR